MESWLRKRSKKSVVLQLQSSVITLPHHHLLRITMGGGDGLSSLAFLLTLGDHTAMVITRIMLTPTIMVGITGNRRAMGKREGLWF